MSQEMAAVRAFLVLPPACVSPHVAECLDVFCAGADAASLLLPKPGDVRVKGADDLLAGLARRAGELGLAVLVAGDVAAMRALGADGVHLTDMDAKALARLRRELGEECIIGACCPTQRHVAMELGEAGADYLGIDQRLEARGENLLAWWAEMFTVPVVAMHPVAPEGLADVARLGADFAVPEAVMWDNADTAAALAGRWAESLRQLQQGHGAESKNG